MLLTIDIGGTTIKYATIDRDKNITNKGYINTETDDYKIFIKNLMDIYDQNNFVEGISLGVPGAVNSEGKSIGVSAIPCIFGNNIKVDLMNYTNKRVEIENDANCSAISELWDSKEIKDIVSIVIGTGIGGAIISDGELIKGAFGSAGEIGLISDVNENNKLINTTISMSQSATKYKLNNGGDATGKDLVELHRQGNKIATSYVKNFYRRIALLVMNLEFVLNPEKVVFSGAIINDPEFLSEVKISYNEILNANEGMYNPKSELSISSFGSDSNLIGAAYNWYRKVNKND